ncbi:Hemopexin domain-containing protein [Moniliophthora roreri]|nr:Hemopexin domain-containing protein [Moniliophthora roreri]
MSEYRLPPARLVRACSILSILVESAAPLNYKIVKGPTLIVLLGTVDAIIRRPGSNDEVYVFITDRYAVIKFQSDPGNSSISQKPRRIFDDWPSLKSAGFENVDAISLVPGREDQAIVSEWPSLREVNFQMVDTVLPDPKDSNLAYFFSGSQYALIRIEPGANEDSFRASVISGPKPVRDEWWCLKHAHLH